jgi:hypothetical protein
MNVKNAMRSNLLIIGSSIILLVAVIYLFVADNRIPPQPVTSPVVLVATAPDGTKLWAVATRDGTIYFPSAHDNREHQPPAPPVQ